MKRSFTLLCTFLLSMCIPFYEGYADPTPTPPNPPPTPPKNSGKKIESKEGMDQPLPWDPAVRKGTLPNGLSYFIEANQKPKNRAELRLVVKVGSVVEDENQLGLAHFVEHSRKDGRTV